MFGETWLLPLGVALTIATAVAARHLLGSAWHTVGGFVLLAGAAAVLVITASRTA